MGAGGRFVIRPDELTVLQAGFLGKMILDYLIQHGGPVLSEDEQNASAESHGHDALPEQ